MPDTARHHSVIVVLHWLSLLLVAVALGSVAARELVEDDVWRSALLTSHKSAGFIFLWISALRIVGRLLFYSARVLDSLPKATRLVAGLSHLVIYFLLIALPLSGWFFSSAAGKPIVLFGLYPVFSLIGKNRDIAESLGELHEWLAWIFLLLIVLHMAAALWHHFIRKDQVLRSMSFFQQE